MRRGVVTTLLTATPDPQRGERLRAAPDVFADLAASLHRHDIPLTVLADELEEAGDADIVRVDAAGANPYTTRWRLIADWLDADAQADLAAVFAVDATDVEMLRDPFPEMTTGVLYIGSEPNDVDFWWLLAHHPSTALFVRAKGDRPLLNAGVIGGDAVTMRAFLADLSLMLVDAEACGDLTDMGAINRTVWSTRWATRVTFGEQVHTVFRAEDRTDPRAWWRHK